MLTNIKLERVMYFFQEMDKIPRKSGNEQAVSTWIYKWAQNMGFEVHQDKIYNLVIKKDACMGYENADTVILQAHMDMVCEKTPDSTHNFDKDPIGLKIDGDWIVSDCGTSIGADNGIGVAYAMAILEDDSLKHPKLEVIFTVCEESTFDGAKELSREMFSGKKLINLDNAVDNHVISGSCGGIGIGYTMPLERDISESDDITIRISVSGMKGGHSGEDIHRGRGNAIDVLIRLIEGVETRIAEMNGGTYRLAIPRDAWAIVVVKKNLESDFFNYIEVVKKEITKEYEVTAPDLKIEAILLNEKLQSLTMMSHRKLINICKLFPNGIVTMNGAISGVVESSINMGTLNIEKNSLKITAEARGSRNSTVRDIQKRVEALAEMTGAQVRYYSDYVPWEYNPNSELRKIVMDTYRECFSKEMEAIVIHAGLEVGMFIEKDPEIDAVAIGPNCEYFHSPNERLSISSTERTYMLLVKILENLH